ncbi:MAG: hypothetical protein EPO41_00305 [Reyranella sp.]|nr:MAG: hypothetical protein EPO41_00305 [Reyranella sp.]
MRLQCALDAEGEMSDMHTDKLPSVESLPAGNMWNSALSTCADSFEEWAAAGAAWQSEVSQFAERRLKDNFSTWLTLLSARDAASVWQAQSAWSVRAAEDYSKEAKRLAELVASVTLSGATPEAQQTTQLLG